ncbi:hypothetical protein JW826_04725 [Candidatus Woesearchaeota archaeon]|nr:hypothetical protein [Candidatus Woesearchaeota archaeon]
MGLFDFLKRKTLEEIHFSELEDWLEDHLTKKKLDEKIKAAKQDIEKILERCEDRLEHLGEASLMNDKIPEKEKQIMEGHRKSYIQKIKRFLNDIDVPDDAAQTGYYHAKFSEKLNSLSEETAKNHAVLQHFFGQEVSKIIRDIKNVEQSLSKLQSDIQKEGVDLIKEAKIKLKQYHEDRMRKDRLETEKESQSQILDNLKRKKEKLESRIGELKKSKEYLEFKDFLDKKKSIEDEVSRIETELAAAFAELQRPLKKYTHNTSHEKLVDKYSSDPAGALKEDETLLIHKVIEKMGAELHLLELKEKQLEKTKELMEKFTKSFLSEKRHELSGLKEMNRDLASQINRSVVALNISENENWKRSIENKMEECEREIQATTQEIEDINLAYQKQKVKEKAKEIHPHLRIHDEEDE